jgi:tRNA (cmo5U34)-methyltransferase
MSFAISAVRMSIRAEGVGLDFFELILQSARKRFADNERIELASHDLAEPLPVLGRFDAVVSSFAIHHLEHERKRALYCEVFGLLKPGGVFANLEHVASPTHRLHLAFFAAIGEPIEDEDPSDRLLDVETQLGWLRELGFDDVDCYWKWLEMALLVGVKPAEVSGGGGIRSHGRPDGRQRLSRPGVSRSGLRDFGPE